MPLKMVSLIVASILLALFAPLTRTQSLAPGRPSQSIERHQDALLRLTTETVTLDAQVVSKKTGAIIDDLKLEDFELYEEGVKQQIEHFSMTGRQLSVLLLFDYTATVSPVIKRLAERAEQVLEHLHPEDEVAVTAFTDDAQLLRDFTSDRPSIVAAIRRAGGLRSDNDEPAFLNEGVYQAALRLSEIADPRRRRVIVVFTDNLSNIDIRHRKHTEKEALSELYEAGATVCGVKIKSLRSYVMQYSARPLESVIGFKNPAGSIHSYAEKTGGEIISGKGDDAAEKLAEVFDHLRRAYGFGYAPTSMAANGKFRRLKLQLTVEAKNRVGDVIIRTRQGYYPHQ